LPMDRAHEQAHKLQGRVPLTSRSDPFSWPPFSPHAVGRAVQSALLLRSLRLGPVDGLWALIHR
jgi:hypothetical protein